MLESIRYVTRRSTMVNARRARPRQKAYTKRNTPRSVHTTFAAKRFVKLAVYRAPRTVHSTPCTAHRTPCTAHRTPYIIHRTPYTVHRILRTAPHTAYTVTGGAQVFCTVHRGSKRNVKTKRNSMFHAVTRLHNRFISCS